MEEAAWDSPTRTSCRWDFLMLSMSAARNGEIEKATEWLLHPLSEFNGIGMPIGRVRLPTPYFPRDRCVESLLYAATMMARGCQWDASQEDVPGFPEDGWKVLVEGMSLAL